MVGLRSALRSRVRSPVILQSGAALPPDDRGANSGYDFFIVIRTSSGIDWTPDRHNGHLIRARPLVRGHAEQHGILQAAPGHVCVQPVNPNGQFGDLHWAVLEALAESA